MTLAEGGRGETKPEARAGGHTCLIHSITRLVKGWQELRCCYGPQGHCSDSDGKAPASTDTGVSEKSTQAKMT